MELGNRRDWVSQTNSSQSQAKRTRLTCHFRVFKSTHENIVKKMLGDEL